MDEVPYIDIEIHSSELKQEIRKMDFGKFRVCSKCGQLWPQQCTRCLHCENKSFMNLKDYYESTFNKPFINEEWSFGEK